MEVKAPVSRTRRARARRGAGVWGVGRRALRWRRESLALERRDAVCGLWGGREESWERMRERSFSDDMVAVRVDGFGGGRDVRIRWTDESVVSICMAVGSEGVAGWTRWMV